jgi:anti-anti-sigma regulatory factor
MRLVLRPELTIGFASEIRGDLAAALRDEGDLTLDGTAVVAVDVTGLQLLVAAQKSAVADGKRIAFEAGRRGEAIESAAATAGFRGELFREVPRG